VAGPDTPGVVSVRRWERGYITKSEDLGDANLRDDAGARVEIAPALGRRWLLGDRRLNYVNWVDGTASPSGSV
jgi:hypothetical protein